MKTVASFVIAALTFLAGACATPPPVVAPGLALRKVVIYRNGVGYFERQGQVRSNRVEFRVRKDEVGDFLASLAVLERGGSSVRSASFPVDVEETRGPESPVPLTVPPPVPPPFPPPPPSPSSSEAESMPPPDTMPTERERSRMRTVVMSLDGKEHDLQVGYIAETPVWRPSYRLVLEESAGGAAASPQANLQVWGIVQNLSGESWTDVSLSLVAEAPLAFDADLATAVIPARPRVSDDGDVIAVVPHAETTLSQEAPPPSPLPSAPAAAMADMSASPEERAPGRPQAMARRLSKSAPGGAEADAATESPRAFGVAGGGRVGAPAPLAAAAFDARRAKSLAALAAVAVQAGTTRYDLPALVTIPDRSATMVMLLDQRVPGEALSMFAPDDGVPDSAAHPFRVARFTNQTGGRLERGPLAIFSSGSFLGQGMTDPLPAGATATVPFALERGVAVDVSHESREEGARLAHIEGGALAIARDTVWLTRYRVRNGGERASKVLLKHPRLPGARLHQPPQGTEDNVGAGSALVPAPLPARASLEVVVDERQASQRQIDWLDPLADDAVKAYLADHRADAATTAALTAAWEIRRALVALTEQRQRLALEQEQRRSATEETRANLKALEKNTAAGELRAKLTARLAADSAKLDDVGKRLIETNLRLEETRIRFTEAVRAIKMSQPLVVE